MPKHEFNCNSVQSKRIFEGTYSCECKIRGKIIWKLILKNGIHYFIQQYLKCVQTISSRGKNSTTTHHLRKNRKQKPMLAYSHLISYKMWTNHLDRPYQATYLNLNHKNYNFYLVPISSNEFSTFNWI